MQQQSQQEIWIIYDFIMPKRVKNKKNSPTILTKQLIRTFSEGKKWGLLDCWLSPIELWAI